MNQAIRKLSGLLVLPVLLAALLLMPAKANAAAYECYAELPVSVELLGNCGEAFEVTIVCAEEADPDQPVPDQTTLSIKGNYKDSFRFYYTEPGDYIYTVQQTNKGTKYVNYDDVVYTVIIQVTNAEDGGLAYQVYANTDDDPDTKVPELLFRNTYTPPGPPAATPSPTPAPTEDPDETAVAVSSATPGGGAATAHIPQTGDNLPLNVLLVVMLAAVAALVVLFVVRKRKNDKR